VNFLETPLPGVLLIEPQVFADGRGFFLETYHREKFRAAGISETFVQDNHSRSARGVLRGLHYQARRPQGKLVRVVRGAVFDVAVDLRLGSPSFGRSFGCELTEENGRMLYVPPGFAHGFCALAEGTDFLYKCTDLYAPEWDRGIRWDDPDLGIRWPISAPLLSPKDSRLPFLRDVAEEELPKLGEREGL
jgi:dTDP-4-dehydrorhamnose 3,5-epimerase